MEKYYTVPDTSSVYEDYERHRAFIDKLSKVFNDFATKHGIESDKFIADVNTLYFIPTENDVKKYSDCFSKTKTGLCKKTSFLSKDWINECVTNGLKENINKPFIPFLFYVTGKSSWRLFFVQNILYCTFCSESKFQAPDEFVEIKASDFYKIIEENNIIL